MLLKTAEVAEAFTEAEFDYMLDPHNCLGLAPVFCDRVLKKYSNID